MLNDACVGDGSPLNSFKIMLKDTAETKINNWRGLLCLTDTRKKSSLSHSLSFVLLSSSNASHSPRVQY